MKIGDKVVIKSSNVIGVIYNIYYYDDIEGIDDEAGLVVRHIKRYEVIVNGYLEDYTEGEIEKWN